MKKSEAIKTVQRMFNEISLESGFDGGFNEMDQAQTDFTLSDEFLNQVSLKGLNMLMNLVEKNSAAGINRKAAMDSNQIAEAINRDFE